MIKILNMYGREKVNQSVIDQQKWYNVKVIPNCAANRSIHQIIRGFKIISVPDTHESTQFKNPRMMMI